MTTEEVPTHAALSPSARDRHAACPGSLREEAKYPDPPSPAADDGTHTHTVLEKGMFLSNPVTLIGQTLRDHVGEFVVDHARFTRAKVALDYVKRREQELAKADGRGPLVLAESRVDPVGYTGRFDQSGTVDIQILGATEAEVIDYKDGSAPVDPNCGQLRQYGVGLLAGHLPGRFLTIRFTVIQPKLAGRMEPIRSHVESIDSFLRTEIPALIAEGAACDKPDAPLIPGDVQCKYCRAKNNCEARSQAGLSAMGMLFQPVTVVNATEGDVMDLAQQAAGKDPVKMDDQQIRQLIEAAPLIKQILKSAEEEAERRMLAGATIPGLKVVNGRGSRKWVFGDDEMEKKLIGLGIPKGSVYKSELISPAQAEKLTWTKRDGTHEQLSPKQIERMQKEYIATMAGKLTVVSEADPRPSAVINAAPLFSPVAPTAAVESVPDFLAVPEWMK